MLTIYGKIWLLYSAIVLFSIRHFFAQNGIFEDLMITSALRSDKWILKANLHVLADQNLENEFTFLDVIQAKL